MSQFTGSSSLHIITASAKNTKSVRLYRSRRLAGVTHTLPVHLKVGLTVLPKTQVFVDNDLMSTWLQKGVNVVELRGVSAKIVNKLVMPIECSFQDPHAQQLELMTSTQLRLIGIQAEGSTIRITVASDSIHRKDLFVSYCEYYFCAALIFSISNPSVDLRPRTHSIVGPIFRVPCHDHSQP